MDRVRYSYVDSPVGVLLLAGDENGLCEITFQKNSRPAKPKSGWSEDPGPFREVARQLRDYFDGKLRKFDVRLAPRGTPFQREVWKALRRIPYGKTLSYGELARRIGKPSASRAVGAANGKNPISIIVPCHRVIGADGSLTGFGGGLAVKRRLLELEGALEPEASLFR